MFCHTNFSVENVAVSARWVPRLLTEEKKQVRVSAFMTFLGKIKSDSTFLSRIITTDESWVHYYEPEDRRMSMVWKNHNSPSPKKAKAMKFMVKVMCIAFLGPVVQSVVSLTLSLRVISLTDIADSRYNILIFFAEKM